MGIVNSRTFVIILASFPVMVNVFYNLWGLLALTAFLEPRSEEYHYLTRDVCRKLQSSGYYADYIERRHCNRSIFQVLSLDYKRMKLDTKDISSEKCPLRRASNMSKVNARAPSLRRRGDWGHQRGALDMNQG